MGDSGRPFDHNEGLVILAVWLKCRIVKAKTYLVVALRTGKKIAADDNVFLPWHWSIAVRTIVNISEVAGRTHCGLDWPGDIAAINARRASLLLHDPGFNPVLNIATVLSENTLYVISIFG
jgi:hypothetical protein